MLRLPEDLRAEFAEPLGRIYTDPALLHRAAGDGPVLAIGDVVTYHLRQADRTPDVAVVDGRTKRDAVNDEVEAAVADLPRVTVENPPASLSEELLVALRRAVEDDEPTVVFVEGEEDLAALPAVVAAPAGASVVYGQPDEGMVHVSVDDEQTAQARDLLRRMEGDADAALDLLA